MLTINPCKKDKNQQVFTLINLLTSLESLVYTKILNNKVFLHYITIKNETTLLLVSIFFAFNTVRKSQCSDINFKGLFIDFYILIQSINRLDKLKTLQMINSTIIINNNIANLTNFIFTIGNIALLEYINLNLIIKLVIFHIMSINMSFLLYFTNIN